MMRCTTLTDAGSIPVPRASTRSRSARAGASSRRWAGSGIFRLHMADTPARSLRSGLRRVPMFENEVQTRCAICGTGLLLGGVLVLAHLPLILLIIPVGILFFGLVADPEET